MKFQTGHEDPNKPDAQRKPKLAVTTRTLEALIRLATAHAKLKLRADEVTKEDVVEAYKLMLQAREEEVAEVSNVDDEDFRPDNDDNNGDAPADRSAKRRKRTQDGSSISGAR